MITWSYWTLGGGLGYTLWTTIYQRFGASATYVSAAVLLLVNVAMVRFGVAWARGRKPVAADEDEWILPAPLKEGGMEGAAMFAKSMV